MIAVAAILAVALAAVSVLFVFVAVDRDNLRDVIEGLRDQLAAEQRSARHWYGVAMGYHDAPGTRSREPRWRQNGRPVGFHESLEVHTAEAQQRIEDGGAVVRLPRQVGIFPERGRR